MKFQVFFKTPDTLEEAIRQELKVAAYDTEDEEYLDALRNDMDRVAEKFIQYGECLTVEFDTEAGTATIVPVKKS